MTRAFDLSISVLVAILLMPVGVVVAVLNWMLTRRIFFRQERLGRGLRPFVILKFQTMADAPRGGSTVTVSHDPRLTPIGRILRTLKLDELPQLINVLRGEMSLVGPRALTANEVAHVPPEVAARVYSVRPGMTGLSSLLFADEERRLAGFARPEEQYFSAILPRKMAIESVYAERKTLGFDLLLLALTPAAILFPGLVRVVLRGVVGADDPATALGASHVRFRPGR